MYSASITNTGDSQYHATTTSSTFLMGQGGANPIDTLVASLCACIGHHVRDGLHERRIAFTELTVAAEASLDQGKRALAHIAVSLTVAGASLSKDQRAELLRQADRCPIYNTLKQAAAIELSFQ